MHGTDVFKSSEVPKLCAIERVTLVLLNRGYKISLRLIHNALRLVKKIRNDTPPGKEEGGMVVESESSPIKICKFAMERCY